MTQQPNQENMVLGSRLYCGFHLQNCPQIRPWEFTELYSQKWNRMSHHISLTHSGVNSSLRFPIRGKVDNLKVKG